MNDNFMYSNPLDYSMQTPPMGSGCGCQGGIAPNPMQGQFTQDMSQYNPNFAFYNQMPYPNMGQPFDTNTPVPPMNRENEERIIPLFIGGLLGASLARPFYGYPAYSYPYYPPYYYGYYNYGYARPGRYPYYYR